MKNQFFSADNHGRNKFRKWIAVTVSVLIVIYSFTGIALYASGLMDGIFSSLDANNHTHALDDNLNTSANIFTQDGYIVYRLDTAGLVPGMDTKLTCNGSDGLAHMVRVESLDIDMQTIPESVSDLDIDGFKNTYRYPVHAGASYLKLYGISGAALYIYEIDLYIPAPPQDIATHANNLSHAYDGSNSTSANVFREDGSVLYLLNKPSIHPAMNALITMNASDGLAYDVTITAYSFDLYFESETVTEESTVIAIDGYKNVYEYAIPNWAVWIRISGLPGAALYIYEIAESFQSPPQDIATHANNLTHAYDGSNSTSANVFREDGSVLYLLNKPSIHPAMNALITMNASNGLAYNVTITAYSFDLYFESETVTEESTVIAINGFKNVYEYTIPNWAAWIRISGIPGAGLYIYEIGQDMTPPGPLRSADANNLDHAYDRSELTSANIFSADGHILYTVNELGLQPGRTARIMMNGADGMLHPVSFKALNAFFEVVPGSEQILWVDGYKPTLEVALPAEAAYIWIQGIPDTALYIYEIYPAIDVAQSAVSATDNQDGTFTMDLVLTDAMGQGVTGKTLSDIEVFISGINTLDTLQSLHNGSYWDITLEDRGDGSYAILFDRTGSLPYTRNWIVRVDQIEIGAVSVTVSMS